MKICDLAIERRTTVFVLLGIITLTGLYSYAVLPRESEPEVVIPLIMVTVAYEGVSPEDMETLVTIPIERKLTGISGVKEIRSSSTEGAISIQIEFEPDVDIESALQKVRDKVDQAEQDLPDDADDPSVREINISELPIMYVCLTGDVGLAALSEVAEELEDSIEAIKGVLDVEVVGDVEREIQIEVDPKRVAEYGVSLADLVTLARVENVNTPGGALELGEAKYLMRVPGEFTSPQDIENLVIKRGAKGIVYLRDIATVKDGFKEVTTRSRLDGRDSVTLTVSKRAGENIIAISDKIKATIEIARPALPAGMSLDITMDTSDDIRSMVSDLENSVLSGLILVLAVVFIFMGFTNAIFVALAIPVSMLITFTVLHASGITLNMVVLFSLILALGMLVDNGIVVVENIYRHAQAGASPVRAAKDGAGEVAMPIIASTLTTIAAFFPMFFWPGIWGSFMVFLPKTLSIALLASLFVGLVVNPALAAVFMRVRGGHLQHAGSPRRSLVLRIYARVLRTALRWRLVTITAAVTALLVISISFFLVAEVEFIPTTDPQRSYIDVDCPEGTSLDTTDALVRQVERAVEPFEKDIEFLIANVGSRGVQRMGGSAGTSHIGRVTLDFPRLETSEVRPNVILRQVRDLFKAGMAGAEIRIEQMQMGPGSGPPISIEISGDEFPVLVDLAQRIQDTIRGVPDLVDLRDDYDKGKPEVRVRVDRQQALLMGLSTQLIGLAVKTAVNGRKAGDFREGDEEYDVMVRFPKSFREDLASIESMTLTNVEGRPIPFSAVARLERGTGLGSLTRVDRKRTVSVMADVTPGKAPPEVLKNVQKKLENFTPPPGYTISYKGQNQEQEEAQAFLQRAFVLALLLILLVLVTQFNSVTQALIIMTSVVLSLAGVFLGLLICRMRFGVLMTGIGCISLAGVVVNNAIVMLDFINHLRARGMSTTDAIVEAGITRFRPVTLTAITTILGLLPMAVGISFDFREFRWIVGSESSQWWGSMAVAVIFGLAFATLLTLVVVPTLYSASETLFGRHKPHAEQDPAAS